MARVDTMYQKKENIVLNKVYNGDVLEVISTIPDKFVDCVITSPPYWQLRDYGFKDQWGLEKTYEEYLYHLWQFMDQVNRVLKNAGTVWINLGDTYFGSGNDEGKQNLEYADNLTKRKPGDASPITGNRDKRNNLKNKCQVLIPHRFAIGCIDKGWIVRNDIIWAKRNGMPESVTDRFSKKHEYFFFMVKQSKYYFDLDAIKEQPKQASQERYKRAYKTYSDNKGFGFGNKNNDPTRELGYKNPGSVSDFWDIPTIPNSEDHYASYNFKLIEKPIIAGCPENGIILDPFCGTGTTLIRALQLKRNVIGIDGKKEYCDIGNKKIKNYLNQTVLW